VPLETGSVTVNAVDDITGDGMSKTLFDSRKVNVDAALDAADAVSESQPRQPDPAKVRTFIQANLAVNGPLVAGYAQAANWPEELLADPPPPIDRLEVYKGLASQCEVDAEGVVTNILSTANSTPALANGSIVLPAGASLVIVARIPDGLGGTTLIYIPAFVAAGG
jgi:hypothetical protein